MKIVAKNLVKRYKRRPVVNGVSIEVNQGEIVGLLGPNGAGKTTTFYMVTGLIRPNEGTVYLDETDVTKWPMHQRSRSGIGYLAQESSVFRRLTVADNIRLVCEMQGMKKPEIQSVIDDLAERLHITKILDRPGGVLSGGERRRVEIARAMATKPKFILLDEPFTGIDPVTIEELQHIIRRLKNEGIGILITDHNVDATLNITEKNYILIDGQIIAEGNADEIRSNELVKKFYLGQGYDAINNKADVLTKEDSSP